MPRARRSLWYILLFIVASLMVFTYFTLKMGSISRYPVMMRPLEATWRTEIIRFGAARRELVSAVECFSEKEPLMVQAFDASIPRAEDLLDVPSEIEDYKEVLSLFSGNLERAAGEVSLMDPEEAGSGDKVWKILLLLSSEGLSIRSMLLESRILRLEMEVGAEGGLWEDLKPIVLDKEVVLLVLGILGLGGGGEYVRRKMKGRREERDEREGVQGTGSGTSGTGDGGSGSGGVPEERVAGRGEETDRGPEDRG